MSPLTEAAVLKGGCCDNLDRVIRNAPFLKRFRELLRGLTMPSRGGCVGDPIAWEREFRRRIEEREADITCD